MNYLRDNFIGRASKTPPGKNKMIFSVPVTIYLDNCLLLLLREHWRFTRSCQRCHFPALGQTGEFFPQICQGDLQGTAQTNCPALFACLFFIISPPPCVIWRQRNGFSSLFCSLMWVTGLFECRLCKTLWKISLFLWRGKNPRVKCGFYNSKYFRDFERVLLWPSPIPCTALSQGSCIPMGLRCSALLTALLQQI